MTGGVGMGTNAPEGRLHVKGSVGSSVAMFENPSDNAFIRVYSSSTNSAFSSGIELRRQDGNNWIIGNNKTGSTSKLVFQKWYGSSLGPGPFEIRDDGIWALKICVSPNGTCPDYVFDADYKLKGIDELENYVKENKHLPNVPSAKEIDSNGSIDVSKMTYALLEKVEELTLYIIEQNKKMENQQKEINNLKLTSNK